MSIKNNAIPSGYVRITRWLAKQDRGWLESERERLTRAGVDARVVDGEGHGKFVSKRKYLALFRDGNFEQLEE